jgi:hypothetical protein
MGAITLVVVYFLGRAREWTVLQNANGGGEYRHTMEIVNQCVFYSLLIAGLIVVVLLSRDLVEINSSGQRAGGIGGRKCKVRTLIDAIAADE